LGFDLQSVAGLKRVDLIGGADGAGSRGGGGGSGEGGKAGGAGGTVFQSRAFHAATQQAHIDFQPAIARSGWYALIVEDQDGHKAYTDPIWVDVVGRPAKLANP
jgi:hypothetical protein